jgi:hypothetical protein
MKRVWRAVGMLVVVVVATFSVNIQEVTKTRAQQQQLRIMGTVTKTGCVTEPERCWQASE